VRGLNIVEDSDISDETLALRKKLEEEGVVPSFSKNTNDKPPERKNLSMKDAFNRWPLFFSCKKVIHTHCNLYFF